MHSSATLWLDLPKKGSGMLIPSNTTRAVIRTRRRRRHSRWKDLLSEVVFSSAEVMLHSAQMILKETAILDARGNNGRRRLFRHFSILIRRKMLLISVPPDRIFLRLWHRDVVTSPWTIPNRSHLIDACNGLREAQLWVALASKNRRATWTSFEGEGRRIFVVGQHSIPRRPDCW